MLKAQLAFHGMLQQFLAAGDALDVVSLPPAGEFRAAPSQVLMGGVGMLGGSGLEMPYPWIMRNCISIHGAWMYPPEAAIRLVGLIRSGLLRLDGYQIVTFDLDHANDAVAHAAANAGPFKMTVIRP